MNKAGRDAPAIVIGFPSNEEPFYTLSGPTWIWSGNGLGWVYRTRDEFTLWNGAPTENLRTTVYPDLGQIRVSPEGGDITLLIPTWYAPDNCSSNSWKVLNKGRVEEMEIEEIMRMPLKAKSE